MLVGFLGLLGLCVGCWIPGDSVAVTEGEVTPQVGYWLFVSLVAGWAQWKTQASGPSRNSLPIATWFGLLFGIWLAICIWQVSGNGNVRSAVHVGWQWLACGLALSIWTWLGRLTMARHAALMTTLCLACTVTVHSLYQYMVSMPATRMAFRDNPVEVMAKSGIVAPPGSDLFMQFSSRIESTEPLGPFALTNSLAGFLVLALLLGMIWIWEQRANRRSWPILGLWGVFLVAGLFCLALTKSRGGWVALVAALLGYFATVMRQHLGESRLARRWLMVLGFALLALFATILISDPLIIVEAPKSLAFRWQYWESTVAMIQDHWLFGIGPGNFQANYARYKAIEASETIADPHCFPLEIAATLGLPGLALFLLWSGFRIASAWPWRTESTLHEHASLSQVAVTRQQGASPFAHLEKRRWLVPSAMLVASLMIWGIPELFGAAPDWLPYLFSLPMACVLAWAITTESTLDLSRAGWTWATLGGLLHLMVNGGWLAPGMMSILLVTTAMALTRENRETVAPSFAEPNKTAMSEGSVRLVGTMLLLVLFWITAWQPWQAILRWRNLKTVDRNTWLQATHRVVDQDRWDPLPLQTLMRDVVQQYREEQRRRQQPPRLDDPGLAEIAALESELLTRNPHDWQVHLEIGRNQLAMAGTVEQVTGSLAHFSQAAERHPSDGGIRVEYAVALAIVGRVDESARELNRAEELDRQTSHSNRKLNAATIILPAPLFDYGRSENGRKIAEFLTKNREKGFPADWYRAEPMVEYLRTEILPR